MSSQRQVDNFAGLFVELQAELQGCLAKLSTLQAEVCNSCYSIEDSNLEKSKSTATPKRFGKAKSKKRQGSTTDEDVPSSSAASVGRVGIPEDTAASPGVAATVIGRKQKTAMASRTCSNMTLDLARARLDSSQLDIEQVRTHLLEGTFEEAQAIILSKTDPNIRFGPTQGVGPIKLNLQQCTPLVIAVFRKQPDLVRWLLDYKAHPDSEYGFFGGALGALWTASVTHATVTAGDLASLKQFVAYRADPGLLASNGASLLWHASYFNQVSIVNYLLEKQVCLEDRADSVDDADRSYTPLHAAAKQGFDQVVTVLADAKAQVDTRDMREWADVMTIGCASEKPQIENYHGPRSALLDAITGGHDQVVSLLIQHGDSCLCEEWTQQRYTIDGAQSQSSLRCLDLSFDTGNTYLIGAIAKGLKKNPKLLDRLTRCDLINFLSCPGETPALIMQAVFQPIKLLFWRRGAVEGRNLRTQRNVAFLPAALLMKVSSGPHPNEFAKHWKAREALPDEIQDFVSELAPEARSTEGSEKQCLVPMTALACPIPGIHLHLDVLVAIAESPCENLFKEATCLAIITSAEQKVKGAKQIWLVIEIAQVCSLVSVNYFLNNAEKGVMDVQLQCALYGAFAFTFMNWAFLALESLGYWCQGMLKHVIQDCMIMISAIVTFLNLVYIYMEVPHPKNSPLFATALGTVICWKWMRVLSELCQFPQVGMHVLPMIATIQDIGPFILVLIVCVAASANLYFAFGLYKASDSFFFMFRLAVFGDFNMDTLELGNEEDFFVRSMLFFVRFCMSIFIMKLWIGVLNVSYANARNIGKVRYVRWRAGAVLEARAVHAGWLTLTGSFRKSHQNRASRVSVGVTGSKTGLIQRLSTQFSGDPGQTRDEQYMWICVDRHYEAFW